MQRRKIFTLLAIGVAGSLLIPATAASAAPARSAAAVAPAPALIKGTGYVIVNQSAGVASGRATFYPTGQIGTNTLVVIANPDGSLPGGMTTAAVKSLAAGLLAQNAVASPQATTAKVVTQASPAHYAWAATSLAYSKLWKGASILGVNWSTRAQYNFATQAGYNQLAAGQGQGYYQGYNGSQFGVWSQLYNLGTAGSDGGGASVPWGEVLSNEEFRAKSVKSAAAGGTFWQ